jgi:endonuclease YncB( thermonuclease family)
MFSATFATADVQGIPRVVDGDTLDFGSKNAHVYVRLIGIDAPEKSQQCYNEVKELYSCGQLSKSALVSFISGRKVTCLGKEPDVYGRLLAYCYVEESDLGLYMVETGNAEAYKKYGNIYMLTEKKAKKAKIGIWSGKHNSPEKYRKGARP